MSMFQACGQVAHVFDAPDRVNKETAEIVKGSVKVQLIGDIPLPNGQQRYDIITLSVDDRSMWEQLSGRRVTVPLGFFAPAKGNIVYFIPKGCRPVLCEASATAS